MILIFLLILLVLMYMFNPYIDIFKDYRGKLHIILWYGNKERKHIDLIGDQE